MSWLSMYISTCIRLTRACSTCAPHVTRCLDTAAPLHRTRAVEMKNVIKIRVTVPLLPKCCCMDDKAEKASRNIWLWTWTIAVLWLWCTVQGKRLFEWSSYAFMQYSHCRNTVRERTSMTSSRGVTHWSGEIWHIMMPVLRQGWVVKQNMTWWWYFWHCFTETSWNPQNIYKEVFWLSHTEHSE